MKELTKCCGGIFQHSGHLSFHIRPLESAWCAATKRKPKQDTVDPGRRGTNPFRLGKALEERGGLWEML